MENKETYTYHFQMTIDGDVFSAPIKSNRFLGEEDFDAFYDKNITDEDANYILDRFYNKKQPDPLGFIRDGLVINKGSIRYKDLHVEINSYNVTPHKDGNVYVEINED
jgi:hypothetical protein